MPAGVISGNSNNVSIGGGQVLFDSYDIGFTDGDITAQRETQTKQLKDGIPLNIVLQVPIEETWKVKIPMVESTAENIARASSNIVATNTAASTVTINDAANQERTFATWHSGSLQAIVLDGPNVANLVVENVAENVTYVANTDYFVDAIKGVVYRNPGGAIGSGATVRVSYEYTPVAYSTLKLGVNLPLVNKKVEIIHVSPVSGDVYHYCYWKCQGTGALDLSLKKQDWLKVDADLVALPDPIGHPTEPTGFIRRVAAASAAAYLAGITVL